MIRDPSDGSTKSAPAFLDSLPSGENDPSVTLDCAGADTGLPPESKKPKDIVRLEKSREWLQNYKSKKGQQNG